MIAIIDYDAGNTESVMHAVRYLGETPCVTSDADTILSASHIILPGVGSFGHAMLSLSERELVPVIKDAVSLDIPFLGICLGMQVLFDGGEESPGVEGLGLLPGQVVRFPDQDGYKIPQMGWNTLEYGVPGRLFRGIGPSPYVYFVHSYYASSEDPSVVTARCSYTAKADVSVEKGNLFGCQFHPEKSGKTGIAILRNFLSTKRGE